MINYKIVLEYDGTKYNGWQKQGNTENTIQGKLESVLKKMVGYDVEVNGSGRTDAGTHATGQVANFKLNEMGMDLKESLNKYLPRDIKVLSCEMTDERFHARLNARSKEYLYRLYVGEKPSVFDRNFVYHYPANLDLEAMKKACRYLVGEYDFKAFSTGKKTKKSTIRTIYNIDIDLVDDEISFLFNGNGFLYNMVRIMTGTLVEIGEGKRKAEDIGKIIESQNRELAGITMPACGLSLKGVKY